MVTSPRGCSGVHGLDGAPASAPGRLGFVQLQTLRTSSRVKGGGGGGGGGVLEPSLTASTSFPGLLAARPYCGPRSRVATGDFDLDAQSW